MALDPVTAVLEVGGKIIDKIWPDQTQKDAAKARLLELTLAGEFQGAQNQADINKVEAASSNLFVSGWRPFIGWVCGSALVYHYIVRPSLPWLLSVIGAPMAPMPPLDMGDLLTVLLGMLGMGALRTREKERGVAA